MNNIVYNIPILPHLKKWLLKHFYPENTGAPVKIEVDSVVGRHIASILIDKRSIKKHSGFTRYEFTETLPVYLSYTLAQRSPSLNKLALLNIELKEIFFSNLFTWIIAQKHIGISAQKACINFISFYRIEDEYSHDTAYRAWLRYSNLEYVKERKQRNIARQKRKESEEPPS